MRAFTSIPFKTESGLSHVNGVAKFSAAGIVLEFESKILGLLPMGVREAKLAIRDLRDVKFKKGVMKRGAKINIRLKSFTQLAGLPNKDGKISLKIVKDDYEIAEEAVSQIQKDLEDAVLSEPPVHTPVSALFDGSEDDTAELPD
ncbi:MAG: hypothetical protein JO053_09410 [Acidobacteria bacterium]|nr:hypothetical protein [Acidobacteriota bacterium]